MLKLHRSSLLALCLSLAGWTAVAVTAARADAPPVPSQPAPKPSGPSCKLDNPETPRGGRLDVSGDKLGDAPLVRIAGKPARILERREGRISVQVAADSDGGPVTVLVDGKNIDCGTLTIIGKNN